MPKKANRYSDNNNYDHTVVRNLEYSPYDLDHNTNAQLTEHFLSNQNTFFTLLVLKSSLLKIKLTHNYTYYEFKQPHYLHSSPSCNPHHCFRFINSKYTNPYFRNFTYRIKSTRLHSIPLTTILSDRCTSLAP